MCTHKCNTMRNASFLSVQSIYKHICLQMWSVDLFDSSLPSDLEILYTCVYYIGHSELISEIKHETPVSTNHTSVSN